MSAQALTAVLSIVQFSGFFHVFCLLLLFSKYIPLNPILWELTFWWCRFRLELKTLWKLPTWTTQHRISKSLKAFNRLQRMTVMRVTVKKGKRNVTGKWCQWILAVITSGTFSESPQYRARRFSIMNLDLLTGSPAESGKRSHGPW